MSTRTWECYCLTLKQFCANIIYIMWQLLSAKLPLLSCLSALNCRLHHTNTHTHTLPSSNLYNQYYVHLQTSRDHSRQGWDHCSRHNVGQRAHGSPSRNTDVHYSRNMWQPRVPPRNWYIRSAPGATAFPGHPEPCPRWASCRQSTCL